MQKLKNEVFKSGALSVREKELIAVALSCIIKCETYLEFHVERAKEAGATKEQLRKSIDVALYLTGPSTLIWSPVIDKIVREQDGED